MWVEPEVGSSKGVLDARDSLFQQTKVCSKTQTREGAFWWSLMLLEQKAKQILKGFNVILRS